MSSVSVKIIVSDKQPLDQIKAELSRLGLENTYCNRDRVRTVVTYEKCFHGYDLHHKEFNVPLVTLDQLKNTGLDK